MESQFREKNSRIFRLLYNLGMRYLQQLIFQIPVYYLSNGRLGRLKAKENFKLLALKVVALAYERWSLTRGSNYNDLTWKPLVFWKTGR